MFELKIENTKGQFLTLTQNESNYSIVSIEGLTPPAAAVTMLKNANRDGSKFSSSFLTERNVVITVALKGDVEKNRLKLYDFLSSGNYCKIHYRNSSRNVYCEGYVEQVEADFFTMLQQVQISILCPDPYLYALNQIYIDISKRFNSFEFPFSIDAEGKEISVIDIDRRVKITNIGEPTGIEITMYVMDSNITVRNPVIYNTNTGEFLKLNIEIQTGEIITINTKKGKKVVKKSVNGEDVNLINSLVVGSTWHQIVNGQNEFTYSSDTNPGQLHVDFKYNDIYRGV